MATNKTDKKKTVIDFNGKEHNIADLVKSFNDFPTRHRACIAENDGQPFLMGCVHREQEGVKIVGNGSLLFPMMVKVTLSNEMALEVSNMVKSRASEIGVKVFDKRGRLTKKYAQMQVEAFCGVTKALDYINGNPKESSISPMVYFCLLRVEDIGTEIENLKAKSDEKG